MDFADIGKLLTDGKNLGGVSQKIYFGLWDDVATWPTEPGSPATLDAAGELTGDIVMKPGKRMYELYTTEDASKLDISPIGEEGGKGFELALHVFAPGLNKKLLGFMNATKNEDLIFVAEDNQHQKYLLGCDLRSAKYSAGEGSGTGSTTDGRRGLGMTFSYRTHSLYEYSGSIPLTPAVAP